MPLILNRLQIFTVRPRKLWNIKTISIQIFYILKFWSKNRLLHIQLFYESHCTQKPTWMS